MPYVSLGTSQPWDGENWPSPLRLFTPVLCAAIPCERPPHPTPPPHGGRGLLGLRRLEENHRSWHKNTCHQRGHFARSRPTFHHPRAGVRGRLQQHRRANRMTRHERPWPGWEPWRRQLLAPSPEGEGWGEGRVDQRSMRIGRFNLSRLSVARPSPQPSPQGEGASNNASAASLLWRGLWPPWRVSEKPLPLRGPGGWGGSVGNRKRLVAPRERDAEGLSHGEKITLTIS